MNKREVLEMALEYILTSKDVNDSFEARRVRIYRAETLIRLAEQMEGQVRHINTPEDE